MKFLFWNSDNRKIVTLHNDASKCLDQNMHQEAYNYSNQAINILLQNKEEFFNSRSYHRGVGSNLYFIRAKSLEILHSQTPDEIDFIIENYKQAAAILNVKHLKDTPFNISISLADFIIKKSKGLESSYIKLAHNHLMKVKDTAELIDNKPLKAECIVRLGACYSIQPDQNYLYDLDKAIECHEYGLKYYEEIKDIYNIRIAKFNLAYWYHDRAIKRCNSSDIECAIAHLKEILELCTDKDSEAIQHAGGYLGNILLTRAEDNSASDFQPIYEVLQLTHSNIDPHKNPMLWVGVSIDLFYAFSKIKEWHIVIDTMPEVEKTYNDTIEKVFTILNQSFSPLLLHKALHVRKQMGCIFGTYTQGDNINELASLSDKLNHNSSNISMWTDVQLSLAREMWGVSPYDEIITTYKETIAYMDVEKQPAQCFDVYVQLGYCYFAMSDMSAASSNYKNAMSLLLQFKNEKEGANTELLRSMLDSRDEQLLPIPFVMLESGDALLALKYLEYLRFHPLTPELEELVLIENQVNRMSLMFQRRQTKMAEASLSSMPSADEKDQAIRRIDGYYKTIKALEGDCNFYHLTESNYLQNLESHIQNFYCWVLVPITTMRAARLVLIPPHSDASEIIVSDEVPSSILDVFKEMVSESKGGWAEIMKNYNSLADESIINAISRMEKYLWESIGSWVYSVVTKQTTSVFTQLAVIAQGPLANLPLCMARSHKKGEHKKCMLDKFSISYLPSLYSLFSLQNRLEFWKYPPKLGFLSPPDSKFINGKPDPENSEELFTLPLERNLSFSSFDQELGHEAKSDHLEFEKIYNIGKESTHWHFSSHGEFNWKSFSKSSIDLIDGEQLTPALLVAFESKTYLRLVVLSACQSGISETSGKELSPESFLTEFLKSGAIGAIGTLWEVPEIAASLVLGRFYHFHITGDENPAVALRSAQIWLRDISCGELCEFIEENLLHKPECRDAANDLIQTLKHDYPDHMERPYDDPLYWASFILVGQ